MCSWKIKSNNNIILGDVLKNLSWSIKYLNYFQMHVFILSWCRNILRLDAKVVRFCVITDSQICHNISVSYEYAQGKKSTNVLNLAEIYLSCSVWYKQWRISFIYICLFSDMYNKNFPIHREIKIEIK